MVKKNMFCYKYKYFYILISFIFLNSCSTEESTLPFRNLQVRITQPIFVDKIIWDANMVPTLGNLIQRTENEGDSFQVVFHNFETKKIARTISITVRNRDLDLEPQRYISYPFEYTIEAAKMSGMFALSILSGGSGNNKYAGLFLLGFSVGTFTLGTTGGFLLGLGRGTYELTDDLWDGFTVNKKEIVLGYNDYEYDMEGRIKSVSSYLPYRSITNEAIPVYDLEGKKQITTIYTKEEPVELFQLDYIYGKNGKNPTSIILKEFIPKLKTTKIRLPIRKQIIP